MWGGRFEGGADPLAKQFGDSLNFDRRLTMYDINGRRVRNIPASDRRR
jgi:argininosuccinate lyase